MVRLLPVSPADSNDKTGTVCRQRLFYFLFCLLQLLSVSILSAGSLSRYGNISVINTKYFDIIYPEQSQYTAQLLALHADSLIEKAAQTLNTEIYYRMPVTVTPDADILNAFYTSVPYNRIVLYDTLPDQQLAVYEETVLSVFYHEIVHAVTTNIKNAFFRGVSAVFSDALSPSLVYNMPTSLTEGIAVALESTDGYGRLNDGYSLQMLRQAKIENRFPSFKNAAGARDIYPAGNVPYLFGGAFTAWVQQKYGMEKCGEFWKKGGNFYLIYQEGGIFKKVYGLDITEAWQQFSEDIFIPPDVTDPFSDTQFTQLIPSARCANQRPVSLSAGNNIIAWIDDASSSVWYINTAEKDGGTPRRLCSAVSADRAALSRDGSLLALSYSRSQQNTTGSSVSRRYVCVYDMKKKRAVYTPKERLRDAAVICPQNEEPFLAAIKTNGQQAELVSYPLGAQKAQYTIVFPPGAIPLSPVDARSGKIAFILRYQGSVYICIADMRTQTYRQWPVPDQAMHITTIAPDIDSDTFVFSWSRGDTLPRLGRITFKENGSAIWQLAKQDISGGIHSPAAVTENTPLIYSAHFYEQTELFTVDPAYFTYMVCQTEALTSIQKNFPAEIQSVPYEVKAYNPFRYITRGILLPLGTVPVYDEYLMQQSTAVAGASWITMDPAEKYLSLFSAGWDPWTQTGGVYMSMNTGIPQISAAAAGSALFSARGFEQSYISLALSSRHLIGKLSTLELKNTTDWYAGSSTGYVYQTSFFQNKSGNLYHTVRDYVQFSYSLLQKWGSGRHENIGFSVSAFMLAAYQSSFDRFIGNTGFSAKIIIPRLLPFHNIYRLTLNLPCTFSAALFPNINEALKTQIQLILISAEIQKSLSVIPLYARNIDISVLYSGSIAYLCDSWDIIHTADILQNRENAPYYDELRLRTELFLAFTFGTVTGIGANIGMDFIWRLHRSDRVQPFSAALVFSLAY